MKVLTKRETKLHSNRPDRNAPIKGLVFAGFEIEAVPVAGDETDGNDRWFRDGNGDFFWSGDVTEVLQDDADNADAAVIEPPAETVDWRQRVNGLPGEWLATEGAGIRVAVLDSGLDFQHPALAHVDPALAANLCASSAGVADTSPLSHGTHCAGLIGAHLVDGAGVSGIAPQATLLIGKVTPEHAGVSAGMLSAAVDWARESGAHVISLSMRLLRNASALEPALNAAVADGIVVVAAAGVNRDLVDLRIPLPARLGTCISVGAVDQAHHETNPNVLYQDKLDYLLPLTNMLSCGRTDMRAYTRQMGSSMATAMVSGIVALAMSYLGFGQQLPPEAPETIRQKLDTIATGIQQINTIDMRIMKPRPL